MINNAGHQGSTAFSTGLFSLAARVCSCACTKMQTTHPRITPAIVSFVQRVLLPLPVISLLLPFNCLEDSCKPTVALLLFGEQRRLTGE
jgi:hypothetical protein